MRTNYVLIDLESLQPDSLSVLGDDHFKVIVFVGATQAKLPFELAATMQRLGEKAEYIKISGIRPNALDFHIAFYIGQIAAQDPSSYFHIVSKDTGFDPLIEHLNAKKIYSARSLKIEDIPLVKAGSKRSSEERAKMVMAKLRQSQVSKPSRQNTLAGTIAALFRKQISEEEVAAVIRSLQSVGFISIEEGKVIYLENG